MTNDTTIEDMGSADLGGSQEMMRAPIRSARAITRTHPRVLSSDYGTHPNDNHGMNLGSAEKALDLYGNDGDENSNDSSEGPDGAD